VPSNNNVKMKKITLMFLMAAIAMGTINSCKKDDDNGGADVAQLEANLTAGDWIQVDHKQDGVSDWDTDWEDCEKDDIATFFTDGSYQIDEGPTKCDPNDPQVSESGTWQLTQDGKQLVMEGFAFEIIKLTSTDMVISLELFDITSTAYFKRK
jgi:hypothetical protein